MIEHKISEMKVERQTAKTSVLAIFH